MREIENDIPDEVDEILKILFNKSKLRNLKIQKESLEIIIDYAIDILERIPNYIDLEKYNPKNFSDCLIVGDIHGSLKSLMRIIDPFLKGKVESMIFLGDYVDRGSFSFVVLIVLLCLNIAWPQRVILLRGNHEDIDVNSRYGFLMDIKQEFKDPIVHKNILNDISLLYEYLSLCCKTPQHSICCHGGLPMHLNSFKSLNKISKPHIFTKNFRPFLEQIRWNDPRDFQKKKFENSFRAQGAYNFNENALIEVLDNNNLLRMIRAHESDRGGFQEMFGGRLLHIFSTEPYFGVIKKAYTIHETIMDGNQRTILRDLDFKMIKNL